MINFEYKTLTLLQYGELFKGSAHRRQQLGFPTLPGPTSAGAPQLLNQSLVGGVPARGMGLELQGPFQPKPLHYSIMSCYSVLHILSALLHHFPPFFYF